MLWKLFTKTLKPLFKRRSGRRALAVHGSTALSLLCCVRRFSAATQAQQLFQADRSIHQSQDKTPAVCEAMKLYCGAEVHTLLLRHLIVLAGDMTAQATSVGKLLVLPLCPSMLSMQPDKLGLCLLFSILLCLQHRKHLLFFLCVYQQVLHE